jgi:predicted Zn-dependent peptidase
MPAGSRNENQQNSGITHLIEHLLFKGTKKRTYREIAVAFDSLGAEFNAFTDKENSCVYADFIDTHLDICLEILFDVVTGPSFLPENIKLEKKVVLEEIKMIKDNPSDDIFNYFYDIVFKGHPLSFPILGTKKSLNALAVKDIDDYFRHNFSSNGIVLSAAGNIDHTVLVDMVKKNLESISANINRSERIEAHVENRSKKITKTYKGKTEASHICYGGLGCSRKSPDKYPLSLFTNILGGSISSRLFQKIREEKGLSYTIFASNTQYTDAGVVMIYAATSDSKVNKVMDLINAEIEDIKKNGIKPQELEIAKENTKGSIVLGVEDISSRMFRLGKASLMDSNVLTIDEILKRVDKVELQSVNDIVYKYFEPEKMDLVIIGKTAGRGPK